MPLKEGNDRETISENIAKLLRKGHPRKQAIAIAFSYAGKKRDVEKSFLIKAELSPEDAAFKARVKRSGDLISKIYESLPKRKRSAAVKSDTGGSKAKTAEKVRSDLVASGKYKRSYVSPRKDLRYFRSRAMGVTPAQVPGHGEKKPSFKGRSGPTELAKPGVMSTQVSKFPFAPFGNVSEYLAAKRGGKQYVAGEGHGEKSPSTSGTPTKKLEERIQSQGEMPSFKAPTVQLPKKKRRRFFQKDPSPIGPDMRAPGQGIIGKSLAHIPDERLLKATIALGAPAPKGDTGSGSWRMTSRAKPKPVQLPPAKPGAAVPRDVKQKVLASRPGYASEKKKMTEESLALKPSAVRSAGKATESFAQKMLSAMGSPTPKHSGKALARGATRPRSPEVQQQIDMHHLSQDMDRLGLSEDKLDEIVKRSKNVVAGGGSLTGHKELMGRLKGMSPEGFREFKRRYGDKLASPIAKVSSGALDLGSYATYPMSLTGGAAADIALTGAARNIRDKSAETKGPRGYRPKEPGVKGPWDRFLGKLKALKKRNLWTGEKINTPKNLKTTPKPVPKVLDLGGQPVASVRKSVGHFQDASEILNKNFSVYDLAMLDLIDRVEKSIHSGGIDDIREDIFKAVDLGVLTLGDCDVNKSMSLDEVGLNLAKGLLSVAKKALKYFRTSGKGVKKVADDIPEFPAPRPKPGTRIKHKGPTVRKLTPNELSLLEENRKKFQKFPKKVKHWWDKLVKDFKARTTTDTKSSVGSVESKSIRIHPRYVSEIQKEALKQKRPPLKKTPQSVLMDRHFHRRSKNKPE